MPATFWERDVAYKRRIRLIVPLVLAAYAAVFLSTGRLRYEDIPRYVGWKGDLQLLPEITVIPELESVEAEPAPQAQVVNETTALDLAPTGDIREEPDASIEAVVKPRVAEAGEGTKPIRSLERVGHRAPSYSDTYVILKMVKPVYPPHERAEGIEGNVTLEILVDELGMVATVNVLSTVGPVSFEDAAIDAARQFQFQPPTENGKPSTFWVRFLIKFRITDAGP